MEKPELQGGRLSLDTLLNLMQLDVKCFQHCQLNERFLCFQIPEKCPACTVSFRTQLYPARFKVPPFFLQAPLTSSLYKKIPSFSLLLQPTDGNYTKFIKSECVSKHFSHHEIGDLHIGITNSAGDIFDFDQNGLSRNSLKWLRIPSIVVNLEQRLKIKQNQFAFEPVELTDDWENFYNYTDEYCVATESVKNTFAASWNNLLENFWLKKDDNWTSAKYDEFNFNCMDFIIHFLLEFGFFDVNEECYLDVSEFHLKNSRTSESKHNPLMNALLKQKFSSEFIEPEFLKCLGFLNLLVRIEENKCLSEKI